MPVHSAASPGPPHQTNRGPLEQGVLGSRRAGGERVRVGVATFDAAVHFYSLREGRAAPAMLVVPNAEHPFCPDPASLVAPLRASRPLVRPRPAAHLQLVGVLRRVRLSGRVCRPALVPERQAARPPAARVAGCAPHPAPPVCLKQGVRSGVRGQLFTEWRRLAVGSPGRSGPIPRPCLERRFGADPAPLRPRTPALPARRMCALSWVVSQQTSDSYATGPSSNPNPAAPLRCGRRRARRAQVDAVLEQVPRMFADTQVLDSCFGGAIEVAIEVRGLLHRWGLGWLRPRSTSLLQP